MASLVPNRSSCLSRMTGGERRFSERLEQKLEDDYLIWYDVAIGLQQRHPDFIVLHPRRGLLVLEVKDWKPDTILRADPSQFFLSTQRGVVKEANPLMQARSCALEVGRLLERDPALRGAEGSRRAGKLAMPWGWGAVLTNITRRQFDEGGLRDILPGHLVICQDEMYEAVDAEAFQQRLWAMFPQVFPVTLTLPQIDRIRWLIFPELRVEPGNGQFGLFDGAGAKAPEVAIPDIIRVMDMQQESLARSLGSDHRVIHGVAGSGKTMILGFRALHLARALHKPILVLCYNKTLAARLANVMAAHGIADQVQVYNFHRWCRHMLVSYHVDLPADGADFFDQMVTRVIAGVDRERIPRFQYGAILIDEGHDFEPDWYRLVVQMVDPTTNALLILYDDAQNIYGQDARRKTSWKSLGVRAQGRTTILRINYRNTTEILSLARSFAHELLAERADDDDGIPLVAPESAGRHGPLPELARAADTWSEARMLADALLQEHARGRAWHDMAVLFRHQWEGEDIARSLGRVGIPCSLARGAAKHNLFAAESVKLVTMHSSKGLEFPFVAIPRLGALPSSDAAEADEMRLLYVAMTRATERLLLLHHAESAFTRRIRNSIHALRDNLAQPRAAALARPAASRDRAPT